MQPTPGPEDEQGMMFDLDDPMAEVEEQEDGSAIVRMDEFKGPTENEDFYSNMAERQILSIDLDNLALKYIKLLDNDKEAREERDKVPVWRTTGPFWSLLEVPDERVPLQQERL
jgi:hypothetical protein